MPSTSKAQQKLFGMAYAVRKGKIKRSDVDKTILDIVDSDMTDKQIKDFTRMKTLKEYIEESILDVDDLVADDTLFIEKWLNENCEIFGSRTIKNGVVDVKGSVLITNKNIKLIDVQFGEVDGNFNCSLCGSLKSLEGTPKKVGGDFDCSYCKSLTSLQGAPKKVGGDFIAMNCPKLKK